MPNFEEHCESTARKLGCRFERVHRWMDSPSQLMGKYHRARRHDPYETPEIAKELFSKHYPNHAHLIKEAVLNHIEIDCKNGTLREEERKESFQSFLRDYKAKREEGLRKYAFRYNFIGAFLRSLFWFPLFGLVSCCIVIGIPLIVIPFVALMEINRLFLGFPIGYMFVFSFYVSSWFAGYILHCLGVNPILQE